MAAKKIEAPGGAHLSNKVFPVSRLIPRRGNPRVPLGAGMGRDKFYCWQRGL